MAIKRYNNKIDVVIPAYNVPDKILFRQIRTGKIHSQITIDLQIYKTGYSKHFFLLDDELMEYSVFRIFIKSNKY